MKKIFSFAVGAVVLLTLLPGCSQKKNNAINKQGTESYIYRTKDMCLLNEADTLIDMNYSDDTLILSKSESKKYVEIVSYDIESSRSRLYQFEVSDFENGLSNNSIMLSDDKDYYLFNNLNSESYLYTIDKESEKIFCQNFTNKNIEKIFTDGKGALYVLSVDYDIRRKYSYIEKYIDNKVEKTIDASEILSDGSTININDLYISENESIYVLYSSDNKVYAAKMNMDGVVAAKTEVDGIFGQRNHFVISAQNDIFVVNYDDNDFYLLNRIDTDTCETTGMYEEHSENCEILNGISNFDYIVKTNNDFLGVIAENGEHEKFDISDENSNCCCAWKNEIDLFSIKLDYANILVNYDKNTGSVVLEQPIETGDNSYIIDSVYKNGEHIYICKNECEEFLLFTDDQGEKQKTVPLEKKANTFYNKIAVDEDKNVYLSSVENEVCHYQKYDNNMKFIDEVSDEIPKGIMKLLCVGNELYSYNGDGSLYQVNYAEKKLVKKEIEENVLDIFLYNGKLLFKTDTGEVHMSDNGVNTEFFNVKEVFDIDEYGVSDILICGMNEFYIYSDIENCIYRVEKKNTCDIKDMKIINVACDINSAEFKDIVSNFYSENENIILKFSDYSSDEKIEKLNIELANGSVPDVIISDGRMDLSVFENIGALNDMSELIEQDEVIDPADYYTNVFKACSHNNKITQIVPFYSVVTGIGKTSVLGNNMGWDYTEFLEMLSNNKDKDILYKGMLQDEVLYTDALYYALSSMIDFNNKKFICSEKFSDYLRALKPYLEYEINENDQYDRNELSRDYEMRFRNNKVLFDIVQIDDIESICNIKDGIIKDEFLFKGIPTEKGNGSFVCPGLRIVMLKSCSEKEAAWKFIRQFLTEEYQKKQSIIYLPVKKSVIEKMFDNCEESQTYIGDEICEIHPPSKQDKEMIRNWLESLEISVIDENRIKNIIYDELKRYLNGEWNEEEVIKEIKRKLEMYLSEV